LAADVRAALEGFNGEMRADRAAPLIFTAWSRQLARGVFIDELGGLAPFERSLSSRNFRDALEGVLDRNDAWWCDDKATRGVAESCASMSDLALTLAIEELKERFGTDVARWRWGDAHIARSEHRPFSRVRGLAPLFETRVPTGGDAWTINVGRASMRADAQTGELYLNDHAPSMRAIYDLADPTRSRFMHSTGQSGLPWSGHYRDFAGRWARVEYVPLWPTGPSSATLRLQP
jgi:penicillin amidase